MAKSKDLFDETTMSFGEHLEALRMHLWKAIIGTVICVIACLFFAKGIVAFARAPVDRALTKLYFPATPYNDLPGFDPWDYLKYHYGLFGGWPERKKPQEQADEEDQQPLPKDTITVEVKAADLFNALKSTAPEAMKGAAPPEEDRVVRLNITAREFEELKIIREKQTKPVTLTVQEAFMMYLKVAMNAGFVLASPWVFYQLWLFVAAGLYPHERKYVHKYLPMSLGLFLGGAAFCFYFVFPFILKFLLGFNESLEVEAQIRLSEWISFAILLPVMFGISFQLPMVMLFLERLSIFSVADYQAKRKIAILVMAFLSMILTPADPGSMVAMLVPLLALYEFGIMLCRWSPSASSPFELAEEGG